MHNTGDHSWRRSVMESSSVEMLEQHPQDPSVAKLVLVQAADYLWDYYSDADRNEIEAMGSIDRIVNNYEQIGKAA